jgi:hypothetical protein
MGISSADAPLDVVHLVTSPRGTRHLLFSVWEVAQIGQAVLSHLAGLVLARASSAV